MILLETILGIGIIGINGYGASYPDTLSKIENVRIIGVCDSNRDALEKFALKYNIQKNYTDYRDLLKNPEIHAVFIATPHFLHFEMVMDALSVGKHVFCEKPLAITSSDAWEMARVARDKDLKLSCHFNQRQTEYVKAFHEIMQQGLFGDIYHINVKWMARYTEFMYSPETSWRTSKDKAGGGILIGRGSHLLDAILYILDNPVLKSVYGSISSKLTGLEVDDHAMLNIKFQNGISVNLECSYETNSAAYYEKMEYEIFGTKSGAYYSNIDGNTIFKYGYNKFPENSWVDLTEKDGLEKYKTVEPITIIGNFIQAVKNGKEPIVTGEEAALVTQIIEMAYKSSELEHVVTYDGKR